jgi:hypothetical protein
MATQIERMMRLFRGYDQGYGTYGKLEERKGSAKKEIKGTAKTIRGPVTEQLWEDHIKGVTPFGGIPIDVNNECVWGCIDIDVYNGINHAYLAELCTKHSYPASVCTTKSGGAHVFLFAADPVPAVDMRTKLSELAVVLGAGGSEIFPKQNEVLYDRGDLGNWLNMPYFEAHKTTRYCVTDEGRQLALSEFISYAEKRVVSKDDFNDIGTPLEADPIEELEDGPPCLKILASRGFPEGSRNNGMFALGVLAKRKYPDTWESVLEDWNRRFMTPPLDSTEVSMIVRSLNKKEYEYRCKDQPCVSYCDAKVCRRQKYGVGGGAMHPVIIGMSILLCDPPLFFVKLSDGGTVECTGDQLLNPRLFQLAALNQQMVVLPLVKQQDWTDQINKCRADAPKIEVPFEVSTDGAFFTLLERFCTDKHKAVTREEIMLGKPFYDDMEERYYFRMEHLLEYLDRMKFKTFNRQQVATRIRLFKGDHKQVKLSNTKNPIIVWWIEAKQFNMQHSPHKITQIQEIPI